MSREDREDEWRKAKADAAEAARILESHIGELREATGAGYRPLLAWYGVQAR
jgi:hypothetical protein